MGKGNNVDYEGQKNAMISEDTEKIAFAAQKTINTLQGIIDDKNYEIERKDNLIEKMRRDFRMEKEKDATEIRKLLMQASTTNTSRNELQSNNSLYMKNEEENNKVKFELEN